MSASKSGMNSWKSKYAEIAKLLTDTAEPTLSGTFGEGKAKRILQHLDLVLRSHALTQFFGLEDPAFRQALDAQLHSPKASTVIFTDILGARAWANPCFYRYVYEQAATYTSRNQGVRWNLNFPNTEFGHLLRDKLEARLIEGNIDIDEVMPDYGSGDQMNLQMVRILSWDHDDMMSDVAQDLIDLHRAFNIPLLFFPFERLGPRYGHKKVEFHLALDAAGKILQEPEGCWVYEEEEMITKEGAREMVPKQRVPLSKYTGKIDPLEDVLFILQQPDCVFAAAKRKELSGEPRKRKIFFLNSPTRDTGGFRGSPTSLLCAIGPLVDEVKQEIKFKKTDQEGLGMCGFSQVNIFDPTFYDEPEKVKNELLNILRRMKPEIIGVSCTFDSFDVALEIADHVKQQLDYNPIIILGGPHCDEVDFSAQENPNNPLQKSRWFDFVIAGDGEYMLLALVKEILRQLKVMPQRRQEAQGGAAHFTESVKKGVLKRAKEAQIFRDVDGIARLYFMIDGEQYRFESSGRRIELDKLPFLHYDYMRKEHLFDFDIFKKNGEIAKCVQVMTHRGCKSACKFCTERVLVYDLKSAYYNSKRAQTVVDEIQHYLERIGIETVFFDDSTFTVEKDFVRELCQKFVGSGLSKKIHWGCLNTFEAAQDEGLLQAMRDAGMRYIYLGLEVLDNKALKEMKKPSNVAFVQKTLEILKSMEVMVGVSILFGYPQASQEAEVWTIEHVGRWVKEGKIHLVSLSLTNYHPSSVLTDSLDREQSSLDYTKPELIERQNRAPWNCFEEGGWYHPEDRAVNEEYLQELLWQVKKHIPLIKDKRRVIVRGKELEKYIDWLWSRKDVAEIFRASDHISSMNEVSLSEYRIVGDYVRYEKGLCRCLREVSKKIQSDLIADTTTGNHHLIWGPSQIGKTFLFEEIARNSRRRVLKSNLMNDDERAFCRKLAELEGVTEAALCLVDEVDARPQEAWPFVVLRSYLNKTEQGLPVTFVLVGSAQVKSVQEFRELLEKNYFKGEDTLKKILLENQVEIPRLTVEDKAVIALSSIRVASHEQGKDLKKVEKAALLYLVLHPSLDRPAMIAKFVGKAVKRVGQGDQLMMDNLFSDKEGEEEEFLSDSNRRKATQQLSNKFVVIRD